eukprot:GHVN01086665.1.p1 GENE.GHVN01086665.1~~GHVN01086665.1.p1  ORF type:complete len:297 (+),score=65.87 GHVN01086665.1:59-949(+)
MWKGDGSEDAFSFDGSTAECISTKQGLKFNCMWVDGDGVSEGEHYYEMELVEGDGMWFGVTNEASFKKGFLSRAFCYAGNVADGGGALITKFGPYPVKGDRVGCLVEFGEKLVIWFYLNDKCLGRAFEVDNLKVPLFPVVGLQANGNKVSIIKKDCPVEREREMEKNEGMKGLWKCSKANYLGEEVEMDCKMRVEPKSSESIALEAEIVNKLKMNIAVADGVFTPGPILNTCMAGPPEKQKMEDVMMDIMGRVMGLEVEGGELVMKAEGGKSSVRFTVCEKEGPKPHMGNVLIMGA